MRRQIPGQPRPENLRPDPAPGDLRLLQAFVNTHDLEEERDELDSPEALREWLARQDLAAPDTPIEKLEWQCALAVREALRSLLRANNGVPVNKKAIDLMNRALSLNRPRLRIGYDQSVSLEPEKTGWAEALAQILEIVLAAMRDGSWERLKACANGRCRWIFFDTSKNRAGKWCCPRRCGSRASSRTYRRRNPKVRSVGWSDREAGMLASLDDWQRSQRR